jgi:hypothetical protein
LPEHRRETLLRSKYAIQLPGVRSSIVWAAADVNGFVNETVRNRANRIDTALHTGRKNAAELHVSDVSEGART